MSTATTSTGPPSRAAGTSITERLVGALTTAWAAIQARHADVPDVVLTLGSGTLGARRGEVTWGHFAAGRWHLTTAGEHAVTADDVDQDDDEHQDDHDDEHGGGGAEPGAHGLAELFVSGEGLRRGARAGAGDAAARGRARGGQHAGDQGHQPPGPLPQPAVRAAGHGAGHRRRPRRRAGLVGDHPPHITRGPRAMAELHDLRAH